MQPQCKCIFACIYHAKKLHGIAYIIHVYASVYNIKNHCICIFANAVNAFAAFAANANAACKCIIFRDIMPYLYILYEKITANNFFNVV